MACVLAEFGDYEDVEVDDGFTKDIDLMLKQAAPVEYKVTEAWKELRYMHNVNISKYCE